VKKKKKKEKNQRVWIENRKIEFRNFTALKEKEVLSFEL
jgi:hypothetical protein